MIESHESLHEWVSKHGGTDGSIFSQNLHDFENHDFFNSMMIKSQRSGKSTSPAQSCVLSVNLASSFKSKNLGLGGT